MPNTLAQPYRTTPDERLVTARPKPAKATLPDNRGQDLLSELVLEVARRAHGKQGVAAQELGKDEGNFSRDTKAGRLTTAQLYALGPTFLAQLGEALVQQYGELTDPKARARRLLECIEKDILELRQFVEAS